QVTGDDNLTSRVLLLLVKLSHANHTGNIQVADEIWDDYLEIEPHLPTLGIDGLNLVAAIRNRRAVSLTDRFLYEEALGVLLHVVSERETLLETMANLYGVPVEKLPRQQLGECLGSLGQVYAFLGTETTHLKAVECFRRAAALFQSPRDRERQLVYLGHLACDMGDAGRPLWEEAISEISKLGSDKPEFRSGEQFLLALWLKGRLVFGDKSQVRSFVQNLPPSTALLQDFSPEEQRNHPFGLIHQTIAMLFAQAWEQTPEDPLAEKALEEFELASQLMSPRAGVLKLLGHVAECRRTLFRLRVSKESKNQRKKLALQLRAVLGLLAENFSPGGWDEDEEGQATGWFGDRDPGTHCSIPERVESLLTGIRFNYW
ncbi:MAG: hypothetical protein KDA84_14775, partial [Planctomycetaceae bacterium]|nr:hypothetical protein [Planctomycetaceae bacterium]